MKGQWIGRFAGTNTGHVNAELDDTGDHYEGTAYVIEDDPSRPPIMGIISGVPKHENSFSLRVPTLIIERATGRIITPDELRQRYPALTYSPEVQTTWQFARDELTIEWRTPVNTSGVCHLRLSTALDSKLQPDKSITSWAQFKVFATEQEADRYVYRGQGNSRWAMRTAFHRQGRYDLHKF
jgi:hypothetical protein